MARMNHYTFASVQCEQRRITEMDLVDCVPFSSFTARFKRAQKKVRKRLERKYNKGRNKVLSCSIVEFHQTPRPCRFTRCYTDIRVRVIFRVGEA